MKPRFFRTQQAFRTWLEKNHEARMELIVGYWKKDTNKPSVTWAETRDEALCFGWIDGVRRRIDDERFCVRFTPRNPKSVWSDVNIARVKAMIEEGRMTPAGMAAFERRDERKTALYSYERKNAELSGDLLRLFVRNRCAYDFFRAQPPGYQRKSAHWVMSAKRESTRLRRFNGLMAACEAGERVAQLQPSAKNKKKAGE